MSSMVIDLEKLLDTGMVNRFELRGSVLHLGLQTPTPPGLLYELTFSDVRPESGDPPWADPLPWGVVGFDAHLSSDLRWAFVLVCDEFLWEFQATWPTAAVSASSLPGSGGA